MHTFLGFVKFSSPKGHRQDIQILCTTLCTLLIDSVRLAPSTMQCGMLRIQKKKLMKSVFFPPFSSLLVPSFCSWYCERKLCTIQISAVRIISRDSQVSGEESLCKRDYYSVLLGSALLVVIWANNSREHTSRSCYFCGSLYYISDCIGAHSRNNERLNNSIISLYKK